MCLVSCSIIQCIQTGRLRFIAIWNMVTYRNRFFLWTPCYWLDKVVRLIGCFSEFRAFVRCWSHEHPPTMLPTSWCKSTFSTRSTWNRGCICHKSNHVVWSIVFINPFMHRHNSHHRHVTFNHESSSGNLRRRRTRVHTEQVEYFTRRVVNVSGHPPPQGWIDTDPQCHSDMIKPCFTQKMYGFGQFQSTLKGLIKPTDSRSLGVHQYQITGSNVTSPVIRTRNVDLWHQKSVHPM